MGGCCIAAVTVEVLGDSTPVRPACSAGSDVMTNIEVKPIATALGAEVSGIDLSAELSDDEIGQIRRALLDHGVIFFRDQALDVEEHKRLALRFGEIFIHPNLITSEDDPGVVNIIRKPGDTNIVGEDWHTDTTMMAVPPMGALLYALEVPPVGGNTLFASQTIAYDRLSDGMKTLIAPLKCIHSDRRVAGPNSPVARAKRSTKARIDDAWRETLNVHPVVRTHPETGRKCLFVNHTYSIAFEGMTEEESRPLLEWLMNWGHRPEFTCRFRWEKGSVAFWDNRCLKHIALHDVHSHDRIMRRIQIAGEAVI
jgi:alpha-ketoglutarate-dependent taurine dioxygenase